MGAEAVLRVSFIVLALAGGGLAVRFQLVAAPQPPPVHDVGVAPDSTQAPARHNPDSLTGTLIARNPFRADRAAATVAYDPNAAGPGAMMAPARPPRPALTLAGILLGAEPAALVDGIPGAEGTRLLRVGDRAGELVVRSIAADRVVIAGRDTTWTLRLRSTFQ